MVAKHANINSLTDILWVVAVIRNFDSDKVFDKMEVFPKDGASLEKFLGTQYT